MASPSDAEINRETYSAYYGDNVAKGGVFLFLCGWMGTWELWGGAISDTDYVPKSGLFEEQEKFVEEYDLKYSDVKFTNVADKGYRCRMAAWRSGRQLLLQPFFAKVDKKFSSKEVLHSAKIASH